MAFRITKPRMGLLDQIKGHLEAIKTGLEEVFASNRITIHYPKERRKYPERFRGLIRFDPTKCISCFQCAFICPANAIQFKLAPNGKYYPCVDYAKCIFCHFCVDTCTKGAMQPSKFHDLAFRSLEEMFTPTEKMVEKPDMKIGDVEAVVEFVEEDGKVKIKKEHTLYLEVIPEEGKIELVRHRVEE